MDSHIWTLVKKKKKRKSRKREKEKSQQTDLDFHVEDFLKTFKTVNCTNTQFHDHKTCPMFHSSKDQRRNPFKVYYCPSLSPNPRKNERGKNQVNPVSGSCLNMVEVAYHPLMFRTTLCNHISNLKRCTFGRYCAFAHRESDLRDRESISYSGPHSTKADPPRLLSSFVPVQDSFNTVALSDGRLFYGWQAPIPPKRVNLTMSLDPALRFLLTSGDSHANAILKKLQTIALSKLVNVCLYQPKPTTPTMLALVGASQNVKHVHAHLTKALTAPYTWLRSLVVYLKKRVPKRAALQMKPFFEQQKRKHNIWIQVEGLDAPEGKRVDVIIVAPLSFKSKADSAMQMIDFCVRSNGLDEFFECCSCMDVFNRDQVVGCESKSDTHYVCTVDCLGSFLKAQFGGLSRNDFQIQCPCCPEIVADESIRQKASPCDWKLYSQAREDAKVEQQRRKLEDEFDCRLREETKKLLLRLGNLKEATLSIAKNEARVIRNSIINLCCPNENCKKVYCDFTGCMALNCAFCGAQFCGWCHKESKDSDANHQHVRNCASNLTESSSYYATDEEIRLGQRRYRIRKLKHYLGKLKKDVRNATVAELKRELEDLGIKQEALFEFGNALLPALDPPPYPII